MFDSVLAVSYTTYTLLLQNVFFFFFFFFCFSIFLEILNLYGSTKLENVLSRVPFVPIREVLHPKKKKKKKKNLSYV